MNEETKFPNSVPLEEGKRSEDLSKLHDIENQGQSSEEKKLSNSKTSDNYKKNESNFEPKIIAFSCYYCAYGAADLAGSMRLNYSPNIRVILIPCTGKMDVIYILRAFEEGADGVYVAGCLEGNCHFVDGNIKAKQRVNHTKKLLDEIGIGGYRLEMFNMSTSMGHKFAQVADEMTERIKKIGQSPIKRKAEMLNFLKEAENLKNKDKEINNEVEIK